MVRLTQWNPTPKIRAAMTVPFTSTSSRSAPPSRRGRVSDGWIGARRGSSIGRLWSRGICACATSSRIHLDSTFVPIFLVLVLRRNGASPHVYLDPSSELARVQRGVLQRLAAECSGLSSLESCPQLGAAARAQRSLEGT